MLIEARTNYGREIIIFIIVISHVTVFIWSKLHAWLCREWQVGEPVEEEDALLDQCKSGRIE